MIDVGGADYFAAHLHGDEFKVRLLPEVKAMQDAVAKERNEPVLDWLDYFRKRLDEKLSGIKLYAWIENKKELSILEGIALQYGYGETFTKADENIEAVNEQRGGKPYVDTEDLKAGDRYERKDSGAASKITTFRGLDDKQRIALEAELEAEGFINLARWIPRKSDLSISARAGDQHLGAGRDSAVEAGPDAANSPQRIDDRESSITQEAVGAGTEGHGGAVLPVGREAGGSDAGGSVAGAGGGDPASTGRLASGGGDVVLQQDARGAVRISKRDAKKIYRVLLSENADVTTLAHEISHIWLDMLGDFVATPRASERIKEDYKKLQAWLGAEEGAPLSVAQQEKFAQATEAYMMRGESPSQELEDTFDALKSWFKRIYSGARRAGFELPDDVRLVFDRMFATDEEIRVQAKIVAGQPLSPSVLGVPTEENDSGRVIPACYSEIGWEGGPWLCWELMISPAIMDPVISDGLPSRRPHLKSRESISHFYLPE